MPDTQPLRGFKAGTVCTVAQSSAFAPGQKVTVEKNTGPWAAAVPVKTAAGRRFQIPPDFLIPDDPAQAPKLRQSTGKAHPRRTAEYQAKKKARQERAAAKLQSSAQKRQNAQEAQS